MKKWIVCVFFDSWVGVFLISTMVPVLFFEGQSLKMRLHHMTPSGAQFSEAGSGAEQR